ncbi:major facilitator superfamily domain-containing protein [Lasiosphaeris hirsuta]|uniref:Major facilitator superfamily domain-containing protein n=1 Tax=Lasiosphaeris hirsuta TaxID=260670 RepID=A0AA40DQQ8_9PEZI|nr:major facilitator superfamily domain-containing protein [Lasiosphaeris hirsuta]
MPAAEKVSSDAGHGAEKPGADIESKVSSQGDNQAPIDAAAERRLIWKLDLTIYPILYVVYMMSFLDRINISNARIQGLTKELDMDRDNRFNIALFIYFIPYILLEVPSNIFIRYVRPSWYLGGLMFCWGIVNMCMGFVQSYGALVALRFLLGIFEAGVLPGIIYLTSMYYKRHEFQTRMSVLFSSTLVGGAFGGLLAYAISKLGGSHGYAAWRWIFIIEGAITAFIAIFAVFFIVDWPEQNTYLTEAEKVLLKRRLAADGSDDCKMDTLNKFSYKLIFSDYKIWMGAFIYMGVGTTGYATTFFMPTILKEFDWTAESAQVHTIPVYVVSAAGMLMAAWASDRLRQRYIFILLGSLVATLGYGLLLGQATLNRDTKYTAIFLIALGGYTSTPIALAWLANNMSGHYKRAFGSGIQVMLGNVAGIIGTNIFLVPEAPRYPTGYGTAFAMMWMGTLVATALYFLLRRENAKRAAGERDARLSQPEEEVNNMGDYHPSFRFTL